MSPARPIPASRALAVVQSIIARATQASQGPTVFLAQCVLPAPTKARAVVPRARHVRAVQLHPSEVRQVLRVLALLLIATPGTPARAAARARRAMLENTKAQAVVLRARRVRPVQLHQSEVRQALRVLALLLIATPGTPARAAARARRAMLGPTKARVDRLCAPTAEQEHTPQKMAPVACSVLVIRLHPRQALTSVHVFVTWATIVYFFDLSFCVFMSIDVSVFFVTQDTHSFLIDSRICRLAQNV